MQNATLAVRAIALVVICSIGSPALAQSILFSTASPGAVDGPNGPGTTQFSNGDIVSFNPTTGLGTILYLADVINDGGLPNVDALYLRSNGNPVFSGQSGTAVFPFDDDQMVEYNPQTDTLSLFYDFGGLITTNGDVDIKGFHVLANGNFLLANQSNFEMDSQNFENGDIVEFNPVTQTASLFFSENLFDGDDDIWVRSISMLSNGHLLISAFNEDTGGSITLGGLTFGRGDLVAYDMINDVGSLFVGVSIFGGATEDFDAVHVIPVPAAAWMFVSGLGLLGLLRRRTPSRGVLSADPLPGRG